MGLVYIDDIKPGMVLEKNLVCPNGRFLLSAGAVFEVKHLKIARSWGITEAYIEGVDKKTLDDAAESEYPQEILDIAEQAQRNRFSNVDHHVPVMQEIYRLDKLHIAKQLATGKLTKEDALSEIKMDRPETPEGLNKNNISAKWLIDKEVGLASFPDIYYKINEVLNSPKSSASHMADVVEKDTSLSAKLLKIVNSAFYSFPSRIDSIRRAITIIGTKELATLAVGVSAIEAFKGIPAELTNMKLFLRHSIACGVFARLLGTYLDGVSTERLFVSGLLHDVGRLVIFRSLPDHSAYSLYASISENRPLCDVEREIFGFEHAEVGSALMEKWKFPTKLVRNVRFHHADVAVELEPSIINIADCLSIAFGSPISKSNIVPSINFKIWESMKLSPSVIQPIVNQSKRQIDEIEDVFFLVK
ncbi:MAG: phosphohydrolase [Denitrovibrio sp.]|nr:MAG: phosphohydrolase [Denitrovibrio sp.]